MNQPVRIILIEDEPTDAELVERELRKASLTYSLTRVETKDAFMNALEELKPDLILADYTLPTFDGITALACTRKRDPDIPFIFVSGTLGEEVAIETLKLGATDYVLKQRLGRLGPAVHRALREAEDQRERRRIERLKDELLDVLAHELYIPVTAIQEGVSQLAEGMRGTITPEQQECCQVLADLVRRLNTIFEKVLLVTQLMAGRLECAFQPTNLAEVVKNVEASFKPIAEAKGVTLCVNGGEHPASAVVDPKRLGEALSQLVKNAIEATPRDGEVIVTSSMTPDGVELSVQDNGCGIPEEELPSLFDRFRWVGGIDDRKTGGLGLGLFIAKALVQAQGGSISVSSTPGQGTRMMVSLKHAPGSTAQGATSA